MLQIEDQEEIIKFLKTQGFKKINKSNTGELDLDAFDLIMRIHEIHYLFYSGLHKAFSIGVKLPNPKGGPGRDSKPKEWEIIMLPRIIYTCGDASALLLGIGVTASSYTLNQYRYPEEVKIES